jgi:hypothetical protein
VFSSAGGFALFDARAEIGFVTAVANDIRIVVHGIGEAIAVVEVPEVVDISSVYQVTHPEVILEGEAGNHPIVGDAARSIAISATRAAHHIDQSEFPIRPPERHPALLPHHHEGFIHAHRNSAIAIGIVEGFQRASVQPEEAVNATVALDVNTHQIAEVVQAIDHRACGAGKIERLVLPIEIGKPMFRASG